MATNMSTEGATNATAEQIVAAAERLFQSEGSSRTTMEDISQAAGVSRQTVYKYFPKRSDIINRICLDKFREVNVAMRSRLREEKDFAAKVTEALALSVEVARENPYIRKMIADLDLLPSFDDDRGQVIRQWQREQWNRLISAGAETGELAGDLDTERVVPWLVLSQLMIQLSLDRMGLKPEDVRSFVRRFMVEPLLRHEREGGSISPGDDAMLAARNEALLAENRALRDLVSDQALELRAVKRDRFAG